MQVTAFGPGAKDGGPIDLQGCVIICGAGVHFFPAVPTCGLHTVAQQGSQHATNRGALVPPAFVAALAASSSVQDFLVPAMAPSAAASGAPGAGQAVGEQGQRVGAGGPLGAAATAEQADEVMVAAGAGAQQSAELRGGYAAAARVAHTESVEAIRTPVAARTVPRVQHVSPFAVSPIHGLRAMGGCAGSSLGGGFAANAPNVGRLPSNGWMTVGGGGAVAEAGVQRPAEADLQHVPGVVPTWRSRGGFRYNQVTAPGKLGLNCDAVAIL